MGNGDNRQQALAASQALTHPDGGIYPTYFDGGLLEPITDAPGERWALGDISLRGYPAASSLQTLITSVVAQAVDHDLSPADIASVAVGLSQGAREVNETLDWDAKSIALLSAPHMTAVTLHDHPWWLKQPEPAPIAAPALDKSIEGAGVSERITTRDGSGLHTSSRSTRATPTILSRVVRSKGRLRLAAGGLLGEAACSEPVGTDTRLQDLGTFTNGCGVLRKEET